ncbi:ABC transporter substrate-binding protein [Novosphingobium sp. KCTC 2891]|uniref:ABC transporter substrate-binding protein n=1 Tax=Novosphingobium sp. KCTC 2891 TaxID=2989730 RepID=UPI002221EEEF|nr:ABC transporter substrate-binding protein [Novosphingobium sp. KCTC 2891]MCW1383141.1 ABC transporter substrate-binding protein [Novosphingobium sp. KCTC 2891]
MVRVFRSAVCVVLPLALLASGCGRGKEGPLPVALVGDEDSFQLAGARLSPAAQQLRAATVEGLVGFDSEGRVVPALADRWIVTDDGQSYIFRLRDGTWPDGARITADAAAVAVRKALAALRGTALGLDLSPVEEVRVMADRVIEIDLAAPVPDLLTLLAQPEMGLPHDKRGSGPMALKRDAEGAILTLIPPERRGLPAQDGFARHTRSLKIEVGPAGRAVARFNDGFVDAVLGGRIDSLPLAGVGGLTRGNVQLDPVIGMFGVMVDRAEGFLADAPNREALALAIDRSALLGAFNVGGWDPTTRIVSSDVEDDLGTVGERWAAMDMAARRAAASERVARWRAAAKAPPTLRIAMPEGAGSRLVLDRLTADFAAIGVKLTRVPEGQKAELRLVDSVARYGRATWFLNQLTCTVQKAVCNPAGDERLAEARLAKDPRERAALLGEAEAEITAANGFIPIARPLRWSLVRGGVTGFALNPWGWHPLPPLAVLPK